MTIAVLTITIVALLFAIAAILFFTLKAPTAGAIFATLALFLALADVKAFQFRRFANDDAFNDGIERVGEGRRLAARSFVRWINISGAGGGGLD